MKSLRDQIACKCRHFNGTINKTCAADAKGLAALPCFTEGAAVPCEKRSMLTEAEVDAEIKDINEHFNGTTIARAAIVAAAGPYQKGVGASGEIDCPVCKGVKTLHYSRAGSNGHVHAACATKDCVSWME